jgi:beta-lactamase regulating signal transducer with metallopeptidase domain
MNPPPVLWLQLVGLLAFEVALIVAFVALLQCTTQSPAWRRTLWQVCIASVVALTSFELTGVARDAGSRITTRIGPGSKAGKSTILPKTDQSLTVVMPPRHSLPPKRPAEIPASPPEVGVRTAFLSKPGTILWLECVWAIGCAILIIRIAVARGAVVVLFRKRPSIPDEQLQERVRRLAGVIGIGRSIRLFEAKRLSGPIAFGLMRPVIGLPHQFTSAFTGAQQEAMLAHELVHLAARDPAWYLLADMAAALLWWHPLVWWGCRQLHMASETAADEASVLVASGPEVLAECLVKLGSRMDCRRAFGWLGMEGFRSGLGRRVERLFALKTTAWRPASRIPSRLVKLLGPLALVITVVLCTAWVAPRALTKGEDMKPQTWKRSLLAVTWMAMLSANNHSIAADAAGNASTKATKPPAERTASAPSKYSKDNDSNAVPESKGVQAMRTKLEQIILPQVAYDALPLGEVINQLIVESARRDPDKLGINFLFSGPPPSSKAIDPATGLPVSGPAEPVDLRSITVRITPPLKQVRLIDALDAISKVADVPIRYAIEEYAIVFSLDPYGGAPVIPSAQSPLNVITVHVGTNNFFANVEKVFGVHISPQPANKMQNDLRQFLVRLGINMDVAGKSVFFNESTGVLMVRATSEELQLVNAAVETLVPSQRLAEGLGGPDRK